MGARAWLGAHPSAPAGQRAQRTGLRMLSQRPDGEHGPAIGGLAELRQGQIEGAGRGGEAGVAAPVDQGGVSPVVARAEEEERRHEDRQRQHDDDIGPQRRGQHHDDEDPERVQEQALCMSQLERRDFLRGTTARSRTATSRRRRSPRTALPKRCCRSATGSDQRSVARDRRTSAPRRTPPSHPIETAFALIMLSMNVVTANASSASGAELPQSKVVARMARPRAQESCAPWRR